MRTVTDREADSRTMELLRDLMSAYARTTPVRCIGVVGNAPLPPDAERARRIDACDLVIRVNGFALDDPAVPGTVGRRADVVILQWGVMASPWLFEDYTQRLYLLNEPGQMHFDVEVLPDWWPADLGLVPIPNREVTVPLARELGLEGRERPQWATTGTVATWLALQAFPGARVQMTGFSFLDDTEQRSWEHAYGDPCRVTDDHDLAAEARLLRRLMSDQRVELLP
jgi:hypothetical protein